MSEERWFPVLRYALETRHALRHGLRNAVPWQMVAPYAGRAARNHGGQTLEQLAGRGGLCPSELVAVLEDRPWSPIDKIDAEVRLGELVRTYMERRKP